jgi:hypothetical protein
VTVQKPDEGLHIDPQILPGGKSLLFQKVLNRVGGQVETWLARLDGSGARLPLHSTSQVLYAPPGYLLYMQGDSLLAHQFDVKHDALVATLALSLPA